MKVDIGLMCTSHFLEKHPVLQESTEYKIKYVNVLEYFANKYGEDSGVAQQIVNNYKSKFLADDLSLYNYDNKALKQAAKGVIGARFKGYKLFTYRYALVCDCLFINASDRAKAQIAQEIVAEIKSIYRERYHKKLDKLFGVLYDNEQLPKGQQLLQYQVEGWHKNADFKKRPIQRILITANMSAGKSTLINALVGKTVSRTMNDACTSKLHYIYNKPFEDNLIYKFDNELTLDADERTIIQNDHNNKSNAIHLSTYFRLENKDHGRFCIIDTPGVNSSLHSDHMKVTHKKIGTGHYDYIIYVVNGENVGTEDDNKYLRYIGKNLASENIIFVFNKLDRYKTKDDSIEDSINKLRNDIQEKLGIANPIICPVSSYAGFLAKKQQYGLELNEDEVDEFSLMQRKFKKEEYDLSKFYPKHIVEKVKSEEDSHVHEILKKCGISCLEYLLQELDHS
ncbi:dynamin family protein [Evansella sp. AB-rgal1]|uniref:dynamin family protein n=1 Tax=Evansella sp. AB-rgal1 TaxID=3242696 RepID=UPI00359DC229